MKDTNNEVELYFNKMIMNKTGQERLIMGFSMFEMARTQILAFLKSNNPNIDSKEINKYIFLRFYTEDFSHEEQKKILMRI